MSPRVRLVVPTERHVERASALGLVAETRGALVRRLLLALAPTVVLADPLEARLALAVGLDGNPEARDDALLGPLLRASEGTWLRTLDALHDALGVLRVFGVTRAVLAKAQRGGEGGQRSTAAARRARALAIALEAADLVLSTAGLADARGAGPLLAKAIGGSPPAAVADALGADRLVSRWIVRWDAGDLSWWRALGGALDAHARGAGWASPGSPSDPGPGGGVWIDLPAIEAPLDASRERTPLEATYDAIATTLDEPPRTHAIAAPLGDLRFEGGRPDASKVALRQADGAEGQARAVAFEVRDALSRGVPIERVAVLLPRPDSETSAPILAALRDAGIVAHATAASSGTSDVDAARARLLARAALSLASRGLPRREVSALLRAGAASSAHEEASRALDDTPSADPRGRGPSLGQSGGAAESEGSLALASLERTAGAYGAAVRAVGEALSRVERDGARQDHVARARGLFVELALDPVRDLYAAGPPPDDAATAAARALWSARAKGARAWEALHAALDRYEAAAARLGASLPISAAVFRHELSGLLDAPAGGRASSRVGAVRVASAWELAGEPLDLLVLVDANEGALPSAASPGPLLSEGLVARLRELGAAAPPSSSEAGQRALAEIAAAVSGAERVVVTFRDRDDAGAILAPSPLVHWLESEEGLRRTRVTTAPLGGRPLAERDLRLARIARAPHLAPADVSRRARVERAREAFFEQAALGAEDRALPPEVGLLPDDARWRAILSAETGGSGPPMSVTALEKLATCAFQGFAIRVLGASEEGRPRSEVPDARDGGTLLHAALAAAFQATAEAWRARPRDAAAIRARGQEAIDEVLDGARGASPLRGLAIDRMRADAAAALELALADEEWDFDAAEQSFGGGRRGGDAWPPIVLAEGTERLTLRGQIDRIDVGHLTAAVRVVDYKSGEDAARTATGTQGKVAFQIAFYAEAAARAHGVARAEGLYLPVKERTLAEHRARPKPWFMTEDALAAAHANALDVVRRFRAGRVLPLVADPKACDKCAIDGGCRKPRFVIRGLIKDDEVPKDT